MDEHELTVEEFGRFARATGYRTQAERDGWSGAFNFKTHGWERVEGANWRAPEGAGSSAPSNEPVCQLSWDDAQAYARWAHKRLPTEAEWEFAARGGLEGNKYAWGNQLRPAGKVVANFWQGTFPTENTREDGFLVRAPIKSFPPNGYGLYDMAGNVWEWCADFYDPYYYAESPRENPQGPGSGSERKNWPAKVSAWDGLRSAATGNQCPD